MRLNEVTMKVNIDKDGCISCGMCAATCPNIFRISPDDDKAEVYNEPSDKDFDCCQEAADNCPVAVISVEK
jgi:ferredoxin